MLNNTGHIDAKIESILAKFAKTKSSEISCFLLIVSWRSFPPKFPVKLAFFSKDLPLKILRNLNFFRQNPTKSADFSANFDFFPTKSADFFTNFDFFPAKSADFSANLPMKIPRNFDFFSANYQKPWIAVLSSLAVIKL